MIPVIIGSGSWGTALTLVTYQALGKAILFSRNKSIATTIKETQINPRLPNILIPDQISVTAELEDIRQGDIIIIACPAQSVREVFERINPYIRGSATVIITAKGIEKVSGKFLSDVILEYNNQINPFVLSGPSFALDVATGRPAAVTLAGRSLDESMSLAVQLSTKTFRIYGSNDLLGAQFGGSAKNVLAIACGVAEGLGLGESARSALLTRGFAELVRMGIAIGASRETLFGLSGLGDLLLTASSYQSRNFSLGVRLARGESINDPLDGVTEGAWTAPVLQKLSAKYEIGMPIVDAVVRILSGEGNCSSEVDKLLSRPIKSEIREI